MCEAWHGIVPDIHQSPPPLMWTDGLARHHRDRDRTWKTSSSCRVTAASWRCLTATGELKFPSTCGRISSDTCVHEPSCSDSVRVALIITVIISPLSPTPIRISRGNPVKGVATTHWQRDLFLSREQSTASTGVLCVLTNATPPALPHFKRPRSVHGKPFVERKRRIRCEDGRAGAEGSVPGRGQVCDDADFVLQRRELRSLCDGTLRSSRKSLPYILQCGRLEVLEMNSWRY